MAGTQRSPQTAPAARFQPPGQPPPSPQEPPPRQRKGGHPGATPQARGKLLRLLENGHSFKEAAGRAGMSARTARAIWREENPGRWPPGAGSGKGGGHPPALTPEQVQAAAVLRGRRQPNGYWKTPVTVIAAGMGVPPATLYRALARYDKAKNSSEEKRP